MRGSRYRGERISQGRTRAARLTDTPRCCSHRRRWVGWVGPQSKIGRPPHTPGGRSKGVKARVPLRPGLHGVAVGGWVSAHRGAQTFAGLGRSAERADFAARFVRPKSKPALLSFRNQRVVAASRAMVAGGAGIAGIRPVGACYSVLKDRLLLAPPVWPSSRSRASSGSEPSGRWASVGAQIRPQRTLPSNIAIACDVSADLDRKSLELERDRQCFRAARPKTWRDSAHHPASAGPATWHSAPRPSNHSSMAAIA